MQTTVSKAAQSLVQALLVDSDWDRGFVEPTNIVKGKTRQKLKFPRNWKVGHAIKS